MKSLATALVLAVLASCSAGDRKEAERRGDALVRGPAPAAGSSTWLESAISKSERIVIGRVTNVQGEPRGPAGEPGVHTRVQVAIDRALLGPAVDAAEFWIEGGQTETRARVVSLQARFEVGEEVLVFLAERRGALRLTEMGLGKWSRVAGYPESFAPDQRVTQAATVATVTSLRADELAERVALRRVR